MLQLKYGRYHNDPIHSNPFILQILDQTRISEGAVTFTQQIFRGIQFFSPYDKLLDKQADTAYILIYTPEIFPFRLTNGLAETDSDRVYHDQIGFIQDRIFIVDQLIRSGL